MLHCCSFDEKFDTKENLIKEYAHWLLLIRRNHSKLGSCVAVTKRHMERFSDITPEEMQDFQHLVYDVEHALKKAFNYDKINYLMLMMVDKHTHFHIFPRYEKPRTFAAMEWVDDWHPDPLLQRAEPVPQETLDSIKEEIKRRIG